MKFKSKSLISIILSIMMVISMILVAVPANAAVIDSKPVGADTYYLWYNTGSNENPITYNGGPVKMNLENDKLVGYFTSTANENVYFLINNSSTTSASTSVWSSEPTTTHSADFNWSQGVYAYYGRQNYGYVKAEIINKPATRVKVVVDTTNSYSVELSLDNSSADTYAVNFGYGGTGTGTVTAKKSDSTTIESGAHVESGTSVTFTATAGENSTFGGWYSDSSCTTAISGADQSSTTYTTTVNATTYVYAKFTSSTTPTTTYYLGGRIKQDGSSSEWLTSSNRDYPFIATEKAGLYKYVSSQTPAVWSETRGNDLPQYFFVHTGSDNPWYGSQPDDDSNAAVLTSAVQSITLQEYSKDTKTDVTRLTYINSTDTTGNVIFYLDTNEGMKLYYEVEGASTTDGAFEIKDKTAVNGSLTFSADGKIAGTADAGNTVNVTAKPYAGFTCSGITVSYTNKTTSENVELASTGSGNSYTFVVPDELTTDITESISVAATFTLDKSAYISTQGDGLWIDVAPNENDSTATLIKWNNYTGNSQSDRGSYIFYVPKNVDLTNANIYNGYGSAVTLNRTSIPADGTAVVSLAKDISYATSGGVSTNVKVMQGSTNAMFLYTTKGDAAYPLPTKIGAGASKDSVKSDGGSCKTMTDTTDTAKQFSAAMALDSVKGRGNSSWEASNKLFGKYAFNMKLASKTNLFGMDTAGGSSGSKSWCLLANNADESMLRNALTYQLAADIGIEDTPEFRFVDIYDNGEYLGAYMITEKVDVGNSKLVKGESFDDINETAANKNVDEGTNRGTYTYNGTQYNMQYANVLPSGSGTSVIDYDKNGKYLLEFEIKKRLFPSDGNESNTASEASWFRSPKGQYVVVKSPEFATKEQVEFIANKFAEMEAKVFTANATKSDLSTVMDVESFAKMYLIQEFSSNLDSAATSYYLTFDCSKTAPVFVANPVWDYDWAYGQYENKVKKDVNENLLNSADPKDWFAKAKQIGDNEADSNNKYSIQSQLASNSNSFKSVVRKVWEQKNGFYDNIKKYYTGEKSQIDKWYDQIKDSVDMNETRWGFIASDPLINFDTNSWGSKNTGANHAEAVNYLENTWTKVRAEEFLNTTSGLLKDSEYAPYTPAKPVISAYNSDLSATITSPINAGTDFVIKVTSEIESGVKYRLYEGSSSAYSDENSDGVFALKATEAGKKKYTVKAVFGTNESSASEPVEVTVVALNITGVTLESSKSTVKPGATFTLTATATPGGLSGVTYKFYKSVDSTVSEDDTLLTSSGNTATVTADSTPDYYYYYVVATDANGNSETSSIVTVNVTNEGVVIENVKIRFKGTTLSTLIPYMSVNGETAEVMTRSKADDAIIGTHLSGAYRFVWFEATIPTVKVGESKTLTFTTNNSKESTMDASITLDFTTCDANNVIYLAVDNLMSGTTAVDITNNATAKTSFGSAMNMIKQSSATDPVTTTLLSTMLKIKSASGQVTTKRYYLGDLNSDNTIGIKDATEIQKSIVGSSELGAEYQSLGDFNADGVVDIKDATAIQKYIAGI